MLLHTYYILINKDLLKKAITEKQKHNVGFKPFNDFNCQMYTNAEMANSLINHVQFWIEMFKKDFVTFPLTFSPQISYESTIYIILHGCGLLGYLIANMCVCMLTANVREHQRGNNKMDNP